MERLGTLVIALVTLSLVTVALGAADQNTPMKSLCQAAADGDLTQVNWHIANRANLNAPDAAGKTPLGCAIEAGHADVAQALLDSAADINTRSSGLTPLYIAARAGQREIVALLLAKGADVNARDEVAGTALHGAAGTGQTEIVQLLLARGADGNARTQAGLTPLVLAQATGHREVAELLQQHQATVRPEDRRPNRYNVPPRDPYNAAMPAETAVNAPGIYGQAAGSPSVLADPNAIRRKVASFQGLAEALAALDESSRTEQRSWQQRRIDNRNSLMRTYDRQFADELALVKKTAQEENAANTLSAMDNLVARRQARSDAIGDALREQRRAALQAEREAERAARGRSTTTTGGRRSRGRETEATAMVAPAETQFYRDRDGRDPNAPPLDQDTEAQRQAWENGAEDKRPVLEAVTETDLRELDSLRQVAAGENANRTAATIEGLMLAHQERKERILQRIADDEERQQRLEERANARGRDTTSQEQTDGTRRGRRNR